MDYWILPYIFGVDWATRDYDGWGDNGFGSGSGVVPPLIGRLLDIPEYNNKLLSYVHEIATGYFGLEVHDDKLDQIKALLGPLAFMGSFSGSTTDWNYTNQDFQDSFDNPGSYTPMSIPATWGLKPYIREREEYIRENYPVPTPSLRLFVNEVVTDNESIITDEAGEYEDYVEIYNDEDFSVDVGGMYLADYAGECRMWRIPDGATIPAKGFLLVWCDEEPLDGPLHTNFKLANSGEGVWLFDVDTNYNLVIDYLLFPALADDEAFGRLPDGSEIWEKLNQASPEASNAGPAQFTSINLGAPVNESVLASPPTFSWGADGGTNNVFAVDFSLSYPITSYWSTYENMGQLIAGYSWTPSAALWNRIPSGSFVFWRVRGADLDVSPLNIIYGDYGWWFYKP